MKITWINVLILLFKMLIPISRALKLSVHFLSCLQFLSIKYEEQDSAPTYYVTASCLFFSLKNYSPSYLSYFQGFAMAILVMGSRNMCV